MAFSDSHSQSWEGFSKVFSISGCRFRLRLPASVFSPSAGLSFGYGSRQRLSSLVLPTQVSGFKSFRSRVRLELPATALKHYCARERQETPGSEAGDAQSQERQEPPQSPGCARKRGERRDAQSQERQGALEPPESVREREGARGCAPLDAQRSAGNTRKRGIPESTKDRQREPGSARNRKGVGKHQRALGSAAQREEHQGAVKQ